MNRLWLIAGLGNPGSQYAWTRHNIGFLAVDLWAKSLGISRWSTEEKALVARGKWLDQDVLFVKPQTFMNRSGESIQPLMHYYKIPLEQLVVAHDELDLPASSMKFQKNRGAGGHNGIKSISERMGSNDYIRMKLGIGRPPHPEMEVADFVLGRFNGEEEAALTPFLNWCGDGLECLLEFGLPKASSLFNGSMAEALKKAANKKNSANSI